MNFSGTNNVGCSQETRQNTSSDNGNRDANETVSRGPQGIWGTADLVELRKLIFSNAAGGDAEDEIQEVGTLLECSSGSGSVENCDSASDAASQVYETERQKMPSSYADGLLSRASTAKTSFGKFVSSVIGRVPWNTQHGEEEKYQFSVGQYSKGNWEASGRQGAVEGKTATAPTESTQQKLVPLCAMRRTNEFKDDKSVGPRVDYDDCHVYPGGTSVNFPNVLNYEDIGALTKSVTEPIASNLSPPPDVSEFKEKITQRVADVWNDNLIREAFSSPSKKSAAIAKWFKDSLDNYYTRALGHYMTSTMADELLISLLKSSHAGAKTTLKCDKYTHSPSATCDIFDLPTFCAIGCLGHPSRLKAFEQRLLDFIPDTINGNVIKTAFGVLCRSGADVCGSLTIDQILLMNTPQHKVFALLSGIGPTARVTSDICALSLFKSLLRRFQFPAEKFVSCEVHAEYKSLARTPRGPMSSTTINAKKLDTQQQLICAISDMEDYLRCKYPDSATSGSSVGVVSLTFGADELTVTTANVGAVRILVAKKDFYEEFCPVEVSRLHTLGNAREKARVIRAGALLSDPSPASTKFCLNTENESAQSFTCPGTELQPLRTTRAVGLFCAYPFGVSTTPDVADVLIPLHNEMFLFMANNCVFDLMSSEEITKFIGSELSDSSKKSPQEIVDSLFDHIRQEWPLIMGSSVSQATALLVPLGRQASPSNNSRAPLLPSQQ